MFTGRSHVWRLLLTVLVLLSTLTVTAAALNPSHGHPSISHDCAVCQAGHLLLVQASAVPQVEPYAVFAEPVTDLDLQIHKTCFVRSAPSRAPPAVPSFLFF